MTGGDTPLSGLRSQHTSLSSSRSAFIFTHSQPTCPPHVHQPWPLHCHCQHLAAALCLLTPSCPHCAGHHNSGREEGSFLAKHRSKSAGWYGGEKIHVFYSLPWAHLHTWNASPLRRTWNLICGLTQGSCKVSFHPPSFRGLSLTLKAGAQALARYEILTLQMAGCRRQWSSEHLTAAPSSAIIFTIVSWPPAHPRTGAV